MKTIKKPLAVIMSLVLVFSVFAGLSVYSAAEDNKYGYLTYSVDEDAGTVTITDCDTDAQGEIIIPDTIEGYPVTKIGYEAFYDCKSITSVTIPDSVTYIVSSIYGGSAFEFCTSLESITVDENNKNYSSDEYGVLFNKDKTALRQYPVGNERTEYNIPDSVTSIGYGAFRDCTSLTRITIPDSVTSIGWCAFLGCISLESVTIPDSVTSIGYGAFEYCTSLTSITVDENNQYYSSDKYGVLFNKDKTAIKQYPAENERTEYNIPDSVITIENYAFYGCTSLESITIPNSITSIGGDTFHGCTSLASITIPDSVKYIGEYVFEDCTSLTSITISDSVISIGRGAFGNCTLLSDVYYSGTIAEWNGIEIDSYNDCLTSATIHCTDGDINPKEEETTQEPTTEEPTTQKPVPTEPSSEGSSEYSDIIASGVCGKYGDNLTWILWADGVLEIRGSGEMADYTPGTAPWYTYLRYIKSVNIGKDVTTVGAYAFFGLSNLTKVSLPNNIYLGDSSFANCTSLKSVSLPKGATIGSSVFAGCTGLETIDYEDSSSLESIGAYAYAYNNALKDFNINDSVKTIGECAFLYCTTPTELKIPESVTFIGKDAFKGCYNAADITVLNRDVNLNGTGMGLTDVKLVNTTADEFGVMKARYAAAETQYELGMISDCDYNLVMNEWEEYEEEHVVYLDEPVAIEGAVMRCYRNSTAEAYAKAHGIKIIYLDEIECDCICHSKSKFKQFWYKFARFFWKLFGMESKRYCECGKAHW